VNWYSRFWPHFPFSLGTGHYWSSGGRGSENIWCDTTEIIWPPLPPPEAISPLIFEQIYWKICHSLLLCLVFLHTQILLRPDKDTRSVHICRVVSQELSPGSASKPGIRMILPAVPVSIQTNKQKQQQTNLQLSIFTIQLYPFNLPRTCSCTNHN
jgi:hypothetical protein